MKGILNILKTKSRLAVVGTLLAADATAAYFVVAAHLPVADARPLTKATAEQVPGGINPAGVSSNLDVGNSTNSPAVQFAQNSPPQPASAAYSGTRTLVLDKHAARSKGSKTLAKAKQRTQVNVLERVYWRGPRIFTSPHGSGNWLQRSLSPRPTLQA